MSEYIVDMYSEAAGVKCEPVVRCRDCLSWQAIADELNARAERTCEIESSYLNDFTVKNMCWYEFEMKCGYKFTWDVMEPPKFCPNCGAKVVDA